MDLVFRKFRNEEKGAASSGEISCVEKLSKDILFGLRKVEIRPGKGTNHLLIHIGEALVKVENNILSAYDCPEEAKSVEWQIIDEWQYVFSCLEPEKWQRFFARMEFGDHEVAFQMLAELYCCSRENGDVISADASALLILLFSSGCIAGPTFLAHQLIATWLASKGLTLEADAWSLSLSQTQLDRSDFTSNLVHKYPTVFSPRKESSKFCLDKEGKETRTLLLAHQFSKLLELAKALLEKQLGVKVCPQGSDNAILIIRIEGTVIKVEKELLTISNVSESTRSAEKSIAENWRTLFTDLENEEYDAAFKKLLKLHYSSLVENDLQAFDASSILLLPFSHGCCTTAPKGWPRYLIGSWIAYKGHYEGASEWFTWSKYDAQHIESEPNLYRYHAIICQRMDTAGRNDRKIKESIREPLRAMCNALRAHGRYEQMMQFLFLTDITDLLPRKPVAMHVQTHLRVIITEATEHYRWLLLSEYFMHNQAMLKHAIQMSDIVLHASALYGMGMYYKYFKKFPHAQKIISDLFEATALVSDLNKLAEDRHVFEATALVLRASICFDIGQIQVSKNDSEKAKKLLEKIPRGALFDQLSDESQRLEACYGADSKSPFDAVKHLLSLDGPKDHHPPSIVAAKENNFLNQIVGQSLSPSLMQKLGSTFKQASQQQLHAEQEESETIVDAFMRLGRDTVLEEKWTFDVLEDFLKKEMQIDFGASSNRDRISYFDRRRGEVFGAMQKLMLSRDQVKDAIVWAERERARDLMHGISQLKSGYDPSCAGVFDKSEKDAWDEIKSISKDEGKGIVFIIYSISWRPISYFLHAEDDPSSNF